MRPLSAAATVLACAAVGLPWLPTARAQTTQAQTTQVQTSQTQDTPPPTVDSGANPVVAPVPAAASQALIVDPTPSPGMGDSQAKFDARLANLEKAEAALSATMEKQSRLKLSGYVQSRYEWHQDATFGVNDKNEPQESSRFYIRRARMRAVYAGKNSEYLMQVGSSGEGVSLVDAEASLVDTWSPLSLRLTMGQFKIPFGFEILQSASEIEMPERTIGVRTIFAGERDRGVRLSGRFQVLRFQAALINGNGTVDPIYRTYDQTSFKDLVGRIGTDFRFLVLGASGYYGHGLNTTAATAATTTAAAGAATYQRFSKLRVGVDGQLYVKNPGVGGLIIRAELMLANDRSLAFASDPAQPCKDRRSVNWYAMVLQNIGEHFGVALRIDQFDPNHGVNDLCAEYPASTRDRVTTLGTALQLYVSETLRGMLAYEHPIEQTATAAKNERVTVQLQAKF